MQVKRLCNDARSRLYLPAFLLVYLPTTRSEEEFLTGVHGGAYASHVSRVPALVPYRLHKISGPPGFAWENIWRDKEISRLLRILAVPFHFIAVAAIFHETPRNQSERTVMLCVSSALALVLNVYSAFVRKHERAMRTIDPPEATPEPGTVSRQ